MYFKFSADRTVVILIAQVFNGILLPFFSICLLLCINDLQFMASSPQKGWANTLLTFSVSITLFLASNVVITKIFSSLIKVEVEVYIRLILAGSLALVILVLLLVFTSLGRDLLRSFKHHCCSSTP